MKQVPVHSFQLSHLICILHIHYYIIVLIELMRFLFVFLQYQAADLKSLRSLVSKPLKYDRSINTLYSSFSFTYLFLRPISFCCGLTTEFAVMVFTFSVNGWFSDYPGMTVILIYQLLHCGQYSRIQVNKRPFASSYKLIFFQILTKTSCKTYSSCFFRLK